MCWDCHQPNADPDSFVRREMCSRFVLVFLSQVGNLWAADRALTLPALIHRLETCGLTGWKPVLLLSGYGSRMILSLQKGEDSALPVAPFFFIRPLRPALHRDAPRGARRAGTD